MRQIDRREFLKLAGGGTAAVATLGACAEQTREEWETFYVGTYTRGESKGIYRCRFNAQTGAVEQLGFTEGVRNPSFLAVSPNGRYLYSVGETSDFEEGSGAVYAFHIDEASSELQAINASASGGAGPCYVSVSRDGRHVFVANYGGGSIAALPVRGDGGLESASAVVEHEGSSVNARRQSAPHAHCILPSGDGRYIFAVDLGLDRVQIYRVDGDGSLQPADPPWADVTPGAGPRHIAFHPDGDRAYVINELDSTVTVFDYQDGALAQRQTVTTLPEGFAGENYPADIHAHPNGRYLYGSNRGHDSIVAYEIAPETGELALLHHASTRGEWPRNFAVHPSGRFLLAANQNTDNIAVFAVEDSGYLVPTEQGLAIPAPVCIRFT